MREISIGVPGPTGLLLFLCDQCRRHDWRRNGIQVTAKQALETARALDADAEAIRAIQAEARASN